MSVAEKDKNKTAFTSRAGTYRFNRMLFVLAIAPAIIQRALNTALYKCKLKSCLVYLDDIIIFSKNNDEHLQNIRKCSFRFARRRRFTKAPEIPPVYNQSGLLRSHYHLSLAQNHSGYYKETEIA